MAKGYSKDLRKRAVGLVEDGESRREAARVLGLGASSAICWIERWRTTGSVAALPGTGHSRSPLEVHRQWLFDLVAAAPDLTLERFARGSSPRSGIDGAMDGPSFLAYVGQILAPTLRKGDIVFMIICAPTRLTAFDRRLYWHEIPDEGYQLTLGPWSFAPPPPKWREFFVREGIPHRTDKEIKQICSSHCIEPGDFDKPVQQRCWEDWFDITGGPLAKAYHLLQGRSRP